MIINGKGLCDKCKRIVMINSETEKIINDNYYKLWCVRCYCNIFKKNEKWAWQDPDTKQWKYHSWHEIELRSLLECRSFEDVVRDYPKVYEKRCDGVCGRIMNIRDIEYPEQVMEFEGGWRYKC